MYGQGYVVWAGDIDLMCTKHWFLVEELGIPFESKHRYHTGLVHSNLTPSPESSKWVTSCDATRRPKFVLLWFIRLPEFTYYRPQTKTSTQVVAQLPVQCTLHCGFISQLGDVTGGFHISRTKSPPRHTTKFSIECAGGRVTNDIYIPCS